MSKQNENSKNRLRINSFEANLKRHPSVKGLFDDDGNMKMPKNSKDEYLLFNIDNKSDEKESNDTSNNNLDEEIEEKEKDKDKEKEYKGKKKNSINVQINRVKEKLVDNKDTFYVEMNDEHKKEILKKNSNKNSSLKTSKPLDYRFSDSQKKFDKDVTDAISKGKEYKEIEGKFVNQLKKK